jgi:hypothetical protein
MRSRFEFEAPTLFQKAILTLKAPHHWRSSLRPYVFDKQSGVRFQVAKDEEAVLKPLTSRLRNGSTPPEVAMVFDPGGRCDAQSSAGLLFRMESIVRTIGR